MVILKHANIVLYYLLSAESSKSNKDLGSKASYKEMKREALGAILVESI